MLEVIDKILNLTECNLCPRNCKVNRIIGDLGYCKADYNVFVASKNLHFGEEPPISGTNGSGTIFFSHCNLGCIYCQNYPISHLGNGKVFSIEQLSDIMLNLQNKKAHNINLVTPSHYANQIAKAITLAKSNGLIIPIVYNCSGYENKSIIEFFASLDLIDIYLVDMKYGINAIAKKYSNIIDYVEINRIAVKTMLEKVGYLELNEKGIAKKGVIVRHLMLPNNFENTKNILDILSEISDVKKIHLSFMAQYHPAYKTNLFPELTTKLTEIEYEKGIDYLEKKGFDNGWIQEL
jgi:putative pyruvate formate lyase activating enzyme